MRSAMLGNITPQVGAAKPRSGFDVPAQRQPCLVMRLVTQTPVFHLRPAALLETFPELRLLHYKARAYFRLYL